jgi:hypothetical protein
MIYRCFEHIFEADARRFVRTLRDQIHDNEQVMHTFRELVLGAYLGANGYVARYEQSIGGKTPDWCIFDESSSLSGIMELTNFHIDKATESEIKQHLEAKGIWTGWLPDNVDRLYQRLWRKATRYKSLIAEQGVPYVVGVFGGFEAAVQPDELHTCLFDEEHGLFRLCHELSGVLFFEESAGQYTFSYTGNPNALRPIELPSGVF